MTYNGRGQAFSMVSFDASSGTPTIGSAFNATITDDGVGLFTINFTVAAANAEHVAVGMARHTTTTGAVWRDVRWRRLATAVRAAGSVKIQVVSLFAGALADAPEISVTVYGVPS